MRNRVLVALLTSLMLLLTGCAQIPRTSDVKAGPELDPQNVNEPIYYSPSGPYDGQSATQLVAGFITAGTGPQNDYATAREFLTKDFKGRWSPSDEVLVQEGGLAISQPDQDTVTVTVKVQARVDADGILRTLTSASSRVLTYKIKQEGAQWRIDSGPNLTILNKPVFDVLFSGYSLYFFDRQNEYLVPELRWFPARASTATRLVTALLDGPSFWLEPAVSPALSGEIKLAIQAVRVQDGIAQINLDAKANSLANEELRLFKAQAQATLTQLPTVNEVAIYLDGLQKTLANATYKQPLSNSTAPITLVDNQLTYAQGTTIQGSRTLLNALKARDFALALDTRELVMLSDSGLQWAKLGQIDRKLATLDPRSILLSPTFDRTGRVWAFGSLPNSEIRTATRSDSQVVEASWLNGYERLSYSISAEGSRMAIVITNEFETKLKVAAIIRDAKGVPTALGQPIEISVSENEPAMVSWFGENRLIIGYRQNQSDAVSFIKSTIGGASEGFGSVTGAKHVLASDLGNTAYVLTAKGDLYENQGYGFTFLTGGVSAAQMPR